MTGPTIREATRADAAELARLVSPLGYPTTADEILAMWDAWTAEGNFALVAAGTTSLLGMITLHSMRVLHRARPVGRITSLAVDPAAQRQGIGRALVAAAERVMAGRGCGILEVTSHTRRSEAHAYYEHLGYSLTSHRFAKDLASDAPA